MSTLNAETREAGKSLATLRKDGFVPAVVYGHGFDNQILKLNKRDFLKLFAEAGESTLVDLKIAGQEPFKILIQDVQAHPVTDEPLHVDLYKVKMDEVIMANVPLAFVGESKAVKELGAVLIKNVHEVEVSCLPADLPHSIEADLSLLEEFDSAVHVKDLKVSDKIKLTLHPEDVIAIASRPREEMKEEVKTETEEEKAAGKKEESEESGTDKKADNKEENKDK